MDDRKPLFLIDVDGVLNPFAARVCPQGFSEHRLAGFRVWLSTRHGEWLKALAADFDLVWATTWEQQANDLIGPAIGLTERLPVISMAKVGPGPTWKLPAVEVYVGSRPFAWLEDDLFNDARSWAKDRGHPTLLLATDPGVGFTRAQFERAQRFAHELRRAAP